MNRNHNHSRGSICELFGRLLPDRTKRLILFTSLAARLCKTNKVSKTTLHRLNELMGLCNTESAMVFPTTLSSVIWDGKEVDLIKDKLNQDEPLCELKLVEIVSYLSNIVPYWLTYKDGSIDQDIIDFVKNRSVVLD